MPLTDTVLRKAKPADKPYKLFDEKGLFLLVHPSGGTRWRFKYRFTGKEKLLALGLYPDVSLAEARDRRDQARKQLANGIDPGVAKKNSKQAEIAATENSFEAVTREWFAKYSSTWDAKHGERIIRRFERDIFPWLGNKPVAQITAPELLTVLRRIESRGAIDTAHRALQNCGQ
ncbi:MAG: tyrosine-type recombinase/integrase, partial [Sulfurifustaceae bacterium]